MKQRRNHDPVVSKGFKSFWNGELGNPYNTDTENYRKWELGFNKAYFINLSNVKKREKK